MPIDEDPFIGTNSRDDNAAQAVLMGLRLLLSHGHRGILKRRSRPQPPISNIKRSPPPLPLLRPTATHLLHQEHLQGLTKHLKWIEDICRSAGLATEVKIIPLKNCFRKNLKDIESTVEAFTGVLETEAIIQLPGGWKVTILMRTLLAAPFFGTCYVATASHDGVAAKLMGRNSFPSYKELEFYLLWCLERSVVNAIRLMEGLGWEQQGQGNTIQKHEVKRLKQAAVQATPKGLTLRWGFAGGRDSVLLFDGGEMDRDLATVLREI